MIYFFFVLSLAINVLMVLYVRFLLQKFLFVAENHGVLRASITDFTDHLRTLRSRPLFYQDDEFRRLFQHSREVEDAIEQFREIAELLPETIPYESDSEEEKYSQARAAQAEIDDVLPFEPEILGTMRKY